MLRKGDEPVPGYRLARFLGRGQYGEVWQATGPGGTRVALKFIDVSGAQGQKELRGVQRVKEIRHPHLMPITALWLLDEDGAPLDDSSFATVDTVAQGQSLKATLAVETTHPSSLVVAMGYCDKDLSNRLAEVNEGVPKGEWKGIPAAELLAHMAESAKAIDFLNSPQHDLGDGLVSIQHCDIKPANIMLVGGAVQVCDFGLARMMGDNLKATATGMVGSPAYMAPECIRKRPSSTTDQYSLAVTYYELRTGKLPFHDLSYMAVLEAHQAGVLDFSVLRDAEQAVLRKATELNPDDRYASCLEMVAALEEALVEELPDLRSSPVVGKLRSQQSVSRVAETARATGAARESERRSRRGSRTATKLGLALALLALVGIAAVVAVPDIRNAVVGLIETDQGKQGEQTAVEDGKKNTESQTGNTTSESIDFVAMLAEAEQTLQDGDLDEAALRFEKLEQSLLESNAQDSAGLRDTVRLGTLRVQVRQPDSDWERLLEHVQELKLANPSDGQNGTRAVALELIARTAIEKTPLKERLKLLVQVEPRVEHLDDWETSQVAELKVRSLADAAEMASNLDDDTWTDLKRLGVDKVGLLLALAERQYKQADFSSSRETLSQARPDATDEQQHRLAEILLLNALADDTFDAKKAVSTFASVAKDVQDPTGVIALLLERVRRTSELMDTAVEQLDQVRQTARGEARAQLDKSYARLLAQRIWNRLSANDVSIPDLMRDCEDARAIDQADSLVNTCWVECQVLSSTSALDGETWRQLDTIVQQALRTKDVESSHAAYFHFVAGLLQHRHVTPRSRNGADEILKTRDMDTELLQVPHRRQQIAEVLVAAATEIGLPTDADLPDDFNADDDTKDAYSYLKEAPRMETAPSDAWKANYIIAAGLVGDPEATDKLLQLSDEMLASEDSKAFLESKQLIGQVLLFSAQAYATRYKAQQQADDDAKAIVRYADLIARFHNPRRIDPKFPDLAFYNRVVQLAYTLVTESLPDTSQVAAGLKPGVARIHGAFARLLERDVAVSLLIPDDVAISKRVARAYQAAAELDERAEYLVGVGRTVLSSPDRIERLTELQDLAARIQALDDQHPEGHALEGHTIAMESRKKPTGTESRELLLVAIEAFDKAVELTKPGDDEYATNYEGLSAARLEAAFYTDTPEGKKPLLERAEEAARLALEVDERLRPENAFNCLGNALEDQAYHLGNIAKYKPSLAAFVDGVRAADDAGRTRAKSLLSAGRCRLRQVLRGGLRPSEKDAALVQAERELDESLADWHLLPQKRAIQHRIAEAQFWRSEVIHTRAMRSATTAEALPLLEEADKSRETSVQLARTSQLVHWATFQVEWSKLAWDRAMSAGSKDEVFTLLAVAQQRAEAVIEEDKLETSSLQVSPISVRNAISQLVQVDLTRCEFLVKTLNYSEWTSAFEKEAEGYARAALENVKRIDDEETSRAARISALTMLGNTKLKSGKSPSFSDQQATVARRSAEQSFRDAVQLAGDDVSLCAHASVGLAESLLRRLGEIDDGQEKDKLREEGLQTLRPIGPEHVNPSYYKQIEALRKQLKAQQR